MHLEIVLVKAFCKGLESITGGQSFKSDVIHWTINMPIGTHSLDVETYSNKSEKKSNELEKCL